MTSPPVRTPVNVVLSDPLTCAVGLLLPPGCGLRRLQTCPPQPAQHPKAGFDVLGLVQDQHADIHNPKDNSTRLSMAQELAVDPCFEFFFTFGQGGGLRCHFLLLH